MYRARFQLKMLTTSFYFVPFFCGRLLTAFLLLAIGEFQESNATHKAGGAMGLITAACAAYTVSSLRFLRHI